METRTLGRTGLEVTILGYGAMELRGGERGRQLSDTEVGGILNAVLDSGINLIDTSIDYGVSEERIGQHISHRRDEYILASKCGCPVGVTPTAPGQFPHIFTPENIRAGVEQSLRRMKTDHLDIVQFHASPDKAELERERSIETLVQLRDEGKIRFLGSSSTLPNIRDHVAMGVFDVFQIPYSLLQRGHEASIDEAVAGGAGTLIRGGVARGAPSEEKAWSGYFGRRNDEAADWWEAGKFDELRGGMSRMEFTLRFTLAHPGLSTTIVGTANPEHLRQNVAAAANGPLPADLVAEAKRRMDELGNRTE